jgi:AbiJ N-terminal domain 4
MAKFSERYGHVPVRSVLQTGSVDDGLRNRLWNLICTTFFASAPDYSGGRDDYLPFADNRDVYHVFKNVWHNYFKQTTDSIGTSYFEALRKLKNYFLDSQWYEVYDVLEFLADSSAHPGLGERFIDSVNPLLKEELSGYRFVSGRIVPITSEEEIAAIEQALALPDSLKPVREHLNQSLTLLAKRKQAHYRNAIKESISAVESLCKIIVRQGKATLGPALNTVEEQTKLPAVLKQAFQKLYGYTSDAQGIRHALMDEPTLDIEDAKFMLVSCSAFVNYLVVKAQKAGITI